MSEKRTFLAKLVIKLNNNGKIVDGLSKQLDIEIDWSKKGRGRILNSEDANKNIVTFEKEGKKYRVAIEIKKIQKGWFKDKVVDYSFEPLAGENFTIYRPDFWSRDPFWLGGEVKRYRCDTIEPTQKRWSGFILIGLLVIAIITVIVFVRRWKKKVDKKIREINY